jgi:hypothetical protein
MKLTEPGFRELFWDTDPATLDPERHATWILGRILERGTLAQWKAAVAHYGRARLVELLPRMRSLSRRDAAFCALSLDIPLADFSPAAHQRD